jgi:hypothetical protein
MTLTKDLIKLKIRIPTEAEDTKNASLRFRYIGVNLNDDYRVASGDLICSFE